MRFALCNEVFADRPLREAFQAAREIGYTGVELAPFSLGSPDEQPSRVLKDVRELSRADRSAIRRSAEHADLAIIGLHWLFAETQGFHLTSPNPATRSATSDYLKALADLCADLGGEVMVLGSPKQRDLARNMTLEEGDEHAAEVLGAAIAVCEERRVRLALEPLGPIETNYLNTAAQAIALIERVDSDACALHLDIKAMASEAIPIPELIGANARHLAHFHANDPNLLGPGMGDVDIGPAINALQEAGYDGWVSVEPFRYEPTRESVARQSLLNLRSASTA